MTKPLDFVVIAGPTASGKTGIAVELARLLPGEVISADSMQVYRHLSIGTAKPTPAETLGVPYHLIDHVDPAEQYTMGRFVREASSKVQEIQGRGKLPVICGGTGLYLRGLIYGLIDKEISDPRFRQNLEKRLESDGLETLYQELEQVDPVAHQRIKPNDRQRIVRALEVYHATGTPLSNLHVHSQEVPLYNCRCFCLQLPRSVLYERINRRVDYMATAGLVEEVRSYISNKYSTDNPAIKALGYAEIIEFLSGSVTLESALDTMKHRTRRYAKRQETWFRGMPCCEPFLNEGLSDTEAARSIMKLVGK